MPPGPAFNWFCVLSSAADILSRAARIRASHLLSATSQVSRKRKPLDPLPAGENDQWEANFGDPLLSSNPEQTKPLKREDLHDIFAASVADPQPISSTVLSPQLDSENADRYRSLVPEPAYHEEELRNPTLLSTTGLSVKQDNSFHQAPEIDVKGELPLPNRNLQSSKVPSSRVGRLFHYGGLAVSLGYGAASEIIRRTGSAAQEHQSSAIMTEANIKRLVSKLSQMRGAALKLGQFLSIQDTHMLSPEIDKIFRRVQDSAHYMPDWQMEKVLSDSLGSKWATLFTSFDRLPFAAASIGQVHNATLSPAASPTGSPSPVAVKIQFPNIANSIDSDLGYIKLILTAGSLLPKGLFLDRTIQVMGEELAEECDYTREASFLRTFGLREYLGDDSRFKVPWVWEGSTDRVLVMEKVNGFSVGEADVSGLNQRDRDDIAARIIELCLKELFEFRLMQTDPNWTNFLWNPHTRQVELVDFGATRAYSKEFIDNWLRLLKAAASEDRHTCFDWSQKLGYLTGNENDVMIDAHVNSMTLLATPFRASTPQPFAFGKGTPWADITAEIRAQIPVMLQHRLTPPPRETYSLNRKLSGAFLLASRLGASVDTKVLWDTVVDQYKFDP